MGHRRRNASNKPFRPARPEIVRPLGGRELFTDEAWEAFSYWSEHATDPVFVYFISELDYANGPTEFIKIGEAKDPRRRIRTLQCGNPRPLRIEAIILSPHAFEKRLHSYFAPAQVSGEWFNAREASALMEFAQLIQARQVDKHRAGSSIAAVTLFVGYSLPRTPNGQVVLRSAA